MNVHSHVIANAAISPYRKEETPLASTFIQSLPDNSVILLDKEFFSAELLLHIQTEATNRHRFIPERKRLVYTELERYGDGDCLLQMKVSPQARKKKPTQPTHWQVSAVTYEVAGKEKKVFTSLPVARFSSGGNPIP